jgi:hypothetical protein
VRAAAASARDRRAHKHPPLGAAPGRPSAGGDLPRREGADAPGLHRPQCRYHRCRLPGGALRRLHPRWTAIPAD